jgi:hypothetical protein
MDETSGESAGANWPGAFADDAAADSSARGGKPPQAWRTIPPVFFPLYVLAALGIAAVVVVACLPNPDVARYKNASQQARDALTAAKELSQGIRPEWTAGEYRQFVERQYAEAGGFLESDEAAELSEFAGCLELAFTYYRQVGDYLEARQLSDDASYGRAAIHQRWSDAGRLVEYADELLDPKTTERALHELATFLREKQGSPGETAE